MTGAAGIETAGTYATHLACFMCGSTFELSREVLLCSCGSPVEVKYDLPAVVRDGFGKRGLGSAVPGVWRYRALLPLPSSECPISLGEGGTPVIRLRELGRALGIDLLVKDESRNPTGSFKARGVSVAASVMVAQGWRSFLVPTTGNGGSAWAAYAARAGTACEVALLGDAGLPRIGVTEPRMYGAQVTRHGVASRAALQAQARSGGEVAYVAGLHEPYRLEGDKTMMFELVEQLGWRAPDVLVWPTGGAVALVGLAKAYEELIAIGTIDRRRPMMLVSAQHESAAPLADALRDGADSVRPGRATGIAPGVQVGDPFASAYILQRVRAVTATTGVSAGDREILQTMRMAARTEGLLLSPEGALALHSARRLADEGAITPGATVVCVNTASGLRYPHLLEPESVEPGPGGPR